MSESVITQCPHCSTSFRVNDAQLGAANGAVRCGTCLKVFNALQHQVGGAPRANAPSAAEAKPAAAPPPAPSVAAATSAAPPAARPRDETLWIHDDLDLDSLNLDEELAKLDEFELNQEFSSIEKAPRPAESLLARRDDERDPHDERWAEALIADAEPAQPARGNPRQEPSLGEPLAEERVSFVPLRRAESLDQLRDEPLQLAWEKPRRQWPRRLGWLLLILLALGGLAAQYIAYHFDELARQDAYRPWFAQLCPEIGCTLPSKVDVEQIRSSNLVVRSHPEFSGALVVDAIIYNRASFSQPFPLLELRFADLNGHLIANRRFKPGEYLGGELAGRTEMPPQVPIHVSLDILDPGPKAVNYSLSFHSPE